MQLQKQEGTYVIGLMRGLYYITYKFITGPSCQFASESGALRWRQNDYTEQDLNSSVLRRFLNVKNISAERVWTSREFQTVGA